MNVSGSLNKIAVQNNSSKEVAPAAACRFLGRKGKPVTAVPGSKKHRTHLHGSTACGNVEQGSVQQCVFHCCKDFCLSSSCLLDPWEGGGSFLFCFLVTHFFHSGQGKTVHYSSNNEACNAPIPIQARQFKGQGKCIAKGKEGYRTYIKKFKST